MIEHATRSAVFSQSRDAKFQKFYNPSWPTGDPMGQTVSSANLTQINKD